VWHLDEATSLNSICWTRSEDGRPLLCAAGSSPRAILIFDLESDQPIRTLPGHGRAINDLQISHLSPDILASASEDYTIRLWNLNANHVRQPCRAILGGQGHKQPLLALDFHPNGRWLLSGAMDTAIALWSVPPLSELDQTITKDVEPRVLPYPCFISQEIHSNYVDCVRWYGDSILSRAARSQADGSDKKMVENEILLWKIDGFDSAMPHPLQPPIPYPGMFTRSAFPHSGRSRGFERLLTFDAKLTARFYLRFGLLHRPGMRPILVMGNEASKFYFWDLKKCEEGEEIAMKKGSKGGRKKQPKAAGLSVESLDRLGGSKNRDASVGSDGASGTYTLPRSHAQSIFPLANVTFVPIAFNATNNSSTSASASAVHDPSPSVGLGAPNLRSATDDPMRPLLPQYQVVPPTTLPNKDTHYASSQVSWSPDGKWLIAVGDQGMMVVFRRG
jgi:polycomb protein EED